MKRTIKLVLVLSCALLLAAAPAFAVKADGIVSENIAEADDTSGQDTNIGSGVKTGHIQDGAVTDSKISGLISAGKIDTEGLNADMVDGLHAADLLQKPANVIIVAKSGGHFTDPVAAAASIADASANNPYLIKVMPGTYDVASSVVLPAHVSIEGSGRDITTISGSVESLAVLRGSGSNSISDLTVVGNGAGLNRVYGIWCVSASGRITDVRVVTTEGASSNYGLVLNGPAADLDNVIIEATSATGSTSVFGISADGTALHMNNVTVNAENARSGLSNNIGIQARNTSLDLGNSTVSADSNARSNYAVQAVYGTTVTVRNCELTATGTGYSIGLDNFQASGPINVVNSQISGGYASLDNLIDSSSAAVWNVAHSQLSGAITTDGIGSFNCFSVYDAGFNAVTCP